MNGWKNYQTWTCYNWLTAEEETGRLWERAAAQALEENGGDKEAAAAALADQIKEAQEINAPDLEPGLYKELIEYGLQQIDYREVAGAFLED